MRVRLAGSWVEASRISSPSVPSRSRMRDPGGRLEVSTTVLSSNLFPAASSTKIG